MRAGIFPGDSTDFKDLDRLAGAGIIAREEISDALSGNSPLDIQRAIYSISTASWDMLNGPLSFNAVAGHSLGFYSALYAAGVFEKLQGDLIVQKAYEAIHEVASNRPGGMTAIIGIKWQAIEDICRDDPHVHVANINSATQVVVSGSFDGLRRVEQWAHEEGALGVKRLEVDAPIHSPFMKGVEEIMRDALRDMELKDPVLPVVSHIYPGMLTRRKEIEDVLCGQFTQRVLWRDAVNLMYEKGMTEFVEMGPSDVLTKIIRWIQRDAKAYSSADAVEHYGLTEGSGTGVRQRV